jgi:hypothetical protein
MAKKAPTLAVSCSVEHRLTRPKGFPGAYIPWQADKGFIWCKVGEVEIKAPNLDGLATSIRVTADRLVQDYQGDDLEAVRVQASVEVDDVRVTFDVLLETQDGA